MQVQAKRGRRQIRSRGSTVSRPGTSMIDESGRFGGLLPIRPFQDRLARKGCPCQTGDALGDAARGRQALAGVAGQAREIAGMAAQWQFEGRACPCPSPCPW